MSEFLCDYVIFYFIKLFCWPSILVVENNPLEGAVYVFLVAHWLTMLTVTVCFSRTTGGTKTGSFDI